MGPTPRSKPESICRRTRQDIRAALQASSIVLGGNYRVQHRLCSLLQDLRRLQASDNIVDAASGRRTQTSGVADFKWNQKRTLPTATASITA